MSFYEDLVEETRADRDSFLTIPIVQRALREGVPKAVYLDFLEQAYHHVRHTCRLLSTAVARCNHDDGLAEALLSYVQEEFGHEQWILNDIDACGGSSEDVKRGQPRLPCRLLIAYVYYAIEHVSPYAMLGMVHVLEGMSAAFAGRAAERIADTIGVAGERGFSYLTSHGALDQEHVVIFRELVDSIAEASARQAIVDTARVVYRLYGDIFRDVEAQASEGRHAA
jgi:pyrroloquinoline quinone (PQQ) biosynthesis protein C